MKMWLDQWMLEKYNFTLTWREIESAEGGFGNNRCRTISDALSRPKTHPFRWFQSGQTDLSFYREPEYIYSLFWAFYKFSGNAYRIAFDRWNDLHGRVIVDVGGSLFTALECAKYSDDLIIVYNLPNTPQAQLIQDYVKEFGANIRVTDDYQYAKAMGDVIFMKAYLEHFKIVHEELDAWMVAGPGKRDVIIVNSFCEIAYGHYIPIQIGNKAYSVQSEADAAFEELMAKRYGVTKSESAALTSKKNIRRYSI